MISVCEISLHIRACNSCEILSNVFRHFHHFLHFFLFFYFFYRFSLFFALHNAVVPSNGFNFPAILEDGFLTIIAVLWITTGAFSSRMTQWHWRAGWEVPNAYPRDSNIRVGSCLIYDVFFSSPSFKTPSHKSHLKAHSHSVYNNDNGITEKNNRNVFCAVHEPLPSQP